MSATSGNAHQNLCQSNDEDDILDIEVSTCGDCNSHCDFKPGKGNAVTVEVTIENNEIVSYHFNASVSIDTQHTQILSKNLPDCDEIESNDSETFEIEVYHSNGPKGNRETLTLDIEATSHEIYCNGADSLDIDVEPQLIFDQ